MLAGILLSPAVAQKSAKAGRQKGRSARPNVILITVDTLRADHVGAYGDKLASTPATDALARDGVLFRDAISQVPLTLAAHTAILTGTYPFYNQVQDFTGEPLAEHFQTVAQAFQRNGYDTGAVVSSFVLDRSWGLARGFSTYDDAFSARDFATKNIALVERRADASVDLALNWLAKPRQKPFFLWLHLYDPHSPYAPPEPFATRFKDRPYDGEIAYVDSQLARFFSYLRRNKLYRSSAIVLVSDHGESLGQHGEREHGFFLYSPTTHVPLIVKPASGRHMILRGADAPVQIMAVGPTLLQLAGIRDLKAEKQFQVPGLAAGEEPEAAYSETYYPFSSFGWSPLRSLRTGQYQFVEAPRPELYDLQSDPGEQHNLAAQKPAIVSAFRERLNKTLAEHAPAEAKKTGGPGVSAEAAEKLRALGYVAYRSPVSAAAIAKGLPDPKDKLEEFNSILRATDLLEAGHSDEARALLAPVEKSDPDLYLVPFLLGESALRAQKWDSAAQELEKALKLNPGFDQAMTALAKALFATDDLAGARKWLEKAIEINPKNYRAWYQLGWVELRSSPAEAKASFERTLAIQPNFALAHRDLGMLAYRQQDYSAAVEHFEAAQRLGMREKELLNFLGIAYGQTGKLMKSVESYKKALQIDPDYADAHLNLALAYGRLGQNAASSTEYQTACRLESRFCQYVPR